MDIHKKIKFQRCIRQLCTEEMINDKTAPVVIVKNMRGNLVGFEAGLGFTFLPLKGYANDNAIFEVWLNEISFE